MMTTDPRFTIRASCRGAFFGSIVAAIAVATASPCIGHASAATLTSYVDPGVDRQRDLVMSGYPTLWTPRVLRLELNA